MSPNAQVPSLILNTGAEIPQLGFGVFQVPPEDTSEATRIALEAGFRHIDTAVAYGNEEGVGQAIADSGIDRDDLFVTTKLWNGDHGRDSAMRSIEGSLERLGLTYVDLYLIHWPVPSRDLYVETWRAFEEIQRQGMARAIGASNFEPEHLERIEAECEVAPGVDQIELHPFLQQEELRSACERRGIVVEAWSPLAQGLVLEDETLRRVAAKHGVGPAEVALAWNLSLGNVVLSKSVTPERIRGNISVVGIELDREDMDAIAGLDRGERVGPDPRTFART